MVPSYSNDDASMMVDFETLNKKDELVKSKSNSKPRRVWQKVAPPLEAPLQEVPPHESSSSKSEPRYFIKEHRKSRSKDLKH
jgi:nitric oxide synthase oxygenase domain/subunit